MITQYDIYRATRQAIEESIPQIVSLATSVSSRLQGLGDTCTQTEAAQALGVHAATVSRMIESEELTPVYLTDGGRARVRTSELHSYVVAHVCAMDKHTKKTVIHPSAAKSSAVSDGAVG